MTEETEYQCVLDGSNVIISSQKGTDGKRAPHIIVARLQSAIAYFKNRDINCKIFFDDATLQQAKKEKRPLVGSMEELQSLLDENEIEIITNDGTMARFAIENEIPIVTNDQFKDWVSGKTTSKATKDITTDDWKKIQDQRIGHKFSKNKFSMSGTIPSKAKSSKKVESKEPQQSNSLEKIRARLESLDDRTKNQTAKIDEMESTLLNLSNLFEDFAIPSAKSNSSALVPCKFEDEFGQSHLCLLGENLHIWQDGKWIEIALGGIAKLLD